MRCFAKLRLHLGSPLGVSATLFGPRSKAPSWTWGMGSVSRNALRLQSWIFWSLIRVMSDSIVLILENLPNRNLG